MNESIRVAEDAATPLGVQLHIVGLTIPPSVLARADEVIQQMDRRAFVCTLGVGLLATPLAAEAQQARRMWRIGLLDYGSSDPARLAWWRAFRDRLRELGYVEGQNVVFQPRWGNGQVSRLQGLVLELVAAKVDILVTAGNPASLAAKQGTRSIPIVTATGPDPVELGLVASLARPGGNVTGMTSISSELSAKRLELLKQLIPRVSRVAALWDRTTRGSALNARDTEVAARSLGLTLHSVAIRPDPRDYDAAFAAMKRDGTGAVIVVQSSAFFSSYQRIADLALTHRLPSAGGSKEYAEAGGLISYGADFPDLFRRAAVFVDKILKGAKPTDLPVEQPTKFELVLNLKTAKALGLTIPPAVLARADEVIE
jgi:putative ABC transport system substrate-binding protein